MEWCVLLPRFYARSEVFVQMVIGEHFGVDADISPRSGQQDKAAGANPWTGGETEPRAVARRRQSITSRDISARTRAATPLLETSGELAAIFFLFTKMQDAKPLGFFVLLAELAGGVFGDGVGFARGGGGREYDLVDAAIS